MTWPTDDLTKVALDQASDDPSAARAELEALVDKVKLMLAEPVAIKHESNTFTQGQVVGTPTGGDKGVGSLNAADLYTNGYPLTVISNYKPSVSNVTSSTTPVDDPHLSGFVLEANTHYEISGFLEFYSASATPGARMIFQESSTRQSGSYLISAMENGGSLAGAALTFTSELLLGISAATSHLVTISGALITHASTAPTVDLQWAQITSNATATQLLKSSWIKFTKLG